MRLKSKLSILTALFVLPPPWAWSQSTTDHPVPNLTPSQVIENKDKLLNSKLVVEGVLENQGTNFFTNSRLVIKQVGSDDALIVRLPVPLETLRPSDDRQPLPQTKSDLLGKKVKLEGILKEEVVKGVGRATVLESTAPPTIQ